MIPVPEYLRKNGKVLKTGKSWTQFRFVCDCGCESFLPYQNCYNAEEEKAMKPYYDALDYLLTGEGWSTCTIDEDGALHHWKFFSEDGLDEEKEEVILPEEPFFAGITVVKVQCTRCGAEHILFDSRYHGYDGVTGSPAEEALTYQPHFRPKCRSAVAVEVKVENDPTVEAFRENTGLELDAGQYANAFSWIAIYVVSALGKRKKIFEAETA